MSADAALVRDTLRALQAQRRFWVEIPGAGWAVQMRRPLAAELAGLLDGVTVEHAIAYAEGWRDVTAAHLIGAAGGSDPLPFDRELFGAWLRDQPAAIQAIVDAMVGAVTRHMQEHNDAGKP